MFLAENIAPVPIEFYLMKLRSALSQCIVVGDQHKFLSLLVAPLLEQDCKTGEPTENLMGAALQVGG